MNAFVPFELTDAERAAFQDARQRWIECGVRRIAEPLSDDGMRRLAASVIAMALRDLGAKRTGVRVRRHQNGSEYIEVSDVRRERARDSARLFLTGATPTFRLSRDLYAAIVDIAPERLALAVHDDQTRARLTFQMRTFRAGGRHVDDDAE